METVQILRWALSLIVGYFLGNFETSVLISRAFFRDDVRLHGSGNAGTTNMLRVFGLGPGALTFVGDFVKGILAVLIGRLIAGELGGYLAGLGAVLGHDFPVLFHLRGGKGVATTFGIAWMISPLCAAIITPVTFAVIFLGRRVSVGSLIGITLYTVLVFFLCPWGPYLQILAVALWLLIVIRHTENIKRILHGEENKLIPTPKEVHEKHGEKARQKGANEANESQKA